MFPKRRHFGPGTGQWKGRHPQWAEPGRAERTKQRRICRVPCLPVSRWQPGTQM